MDALMEEALERAKKVRTHWLQREMHDIAVEQAKIDERRSELVRAARVYGLMDVLEGK